MTDTPKKSGAVDPDLDLDLGWDFDDGDGDAGAQDNARPTVAPPFDLASYAKESMAPSTSAEAAAPPAPVEVVADAPSAAAPRPSQLPGARAPIVPDRVISLPPPPPLPRRPLPPRPTASIPPPPPAPKAPEPVADVAASTSSHVTRPPPADSDDGGASTSSHVTKPPPAPGYEEAATADRPPTKPPGAVTRELEAARSSWTPVPGSLPPGSVPPPSAPPSQRITPREMQRLEDALRMSREAAAGADDSQGTTKGDTLLSLANLRAPLLTPARVPAVAVPSPEPPAVSDKPSAPAAVTDPVVEMQERFALGDYSGALVMAESMLEENPTHVEAREYADSCRAVLQQMYTARIGPLDRVPVVDVARDQLRWLSIDHRTGFILSLVDGVSSLEMILDVCGMPPLDALRMLFELVQQRIISLHDG